MARHCQVIAPDDLPEDTVFETTVSGTTFEVTVPKGGVKRGQVFQAPFPTHDYYLPNENSNSSFLHTILDVSSFFCWCCCCWTILINHKSQADDSDEPDLEQQKDSNMV